MKLKLKYYLRGLGLGIVVTAVIMSIAASKDRKMTNEEIIAKAKQLGMIESTVLTADVDREDNDGQEGADEQPGDAGNEADASGEGEKPISADVAALSKVSAAEIDVQSDGEESEPDAQPDGEVSEPDAQPDSEMSEPDTQTGVNTGQDAQGDADENETGSNENVTEFPKVIVISNGESSYTVSKRLAEIGAIESAADFDTYLCEHGYDKKIRAGTYTIPVGATDEQMAKIVTGSKITE